MQQHYYWLSSVALTVFYLFGAAVVNGDEPAGSASTAVAVMGQPKGQQADTTKFLRVRRDDQGQPVALETAVTRYVPKATSDQTAARAPMAVDLIGAVHVGEPQYYDQLNELFRKYDVVLYELVAPEGTRVVSGQARGSGNPVSFLQNIMKNVLKLEFQLDGIDYSRPNLVHADMSPQEFSKSMKDRGESFLTMFFRVMADSMAVQAKRGDSQAGAEIDLLVALVAKDRSYRLKRIMAEQFETMEEQMSSLSGPKGSTLITERNKRALEVLRAQLASGKQRIAIFYGAGHLSDMERRLDADFGLQKANQHWLIAWSIVRESIPTPVPAAAEVSTETAPDAQ
ncbi:MAG: TraB/GumN family protein [Pirellulaceae bacterium]